ncbi:membrane protein [Streptomyces prasinosporus]|uniref:Membrane protein n=1 Tax=Streptomyces prasinosporus TaxID=68256 RepID=A0ABP6UKG8_9ACTN
MAHTAPRTLVRARERMADTAGLRPRREGRRHPLVATLMALPLAVLLLLVFDGWETVATQASSVGEMLGR